MKKIIIAVWGRGSVGKTTTIKEVYKMLLEKYKDSEEIYNKSAQVEIEVVLRINGHLVGLVSKGDPGSGLDERLKILVTIGCEVIVCATRTRGNTEDYVNSYKPDYSIEWLEQAVEISGAEQRRMNTVRAKQIVRMISEVVEDRIVKMMA